MSDEMKYALDPIEAIPGAALRALSYHVNSCPECACRHDAAAHTGAAEAAPLDVEHPGEPHEFSMTCTKCGKKGMVHLSLITGDQRVTILDPGDEP